MERRVLAVIGVACFLGILSAAFGFAAEATTVKVEDITITKTSECEYPTPRRPAAAFGFASAYLLLLAHVIVQAYAGKVSCKKRTKASGRSWAWVPSILSWICFVFGQLLLVSAAVLNMQDRRSLWEICYVPMPGASAGGAILAIACVVLGVIYYYLVVSNAQKQDQGSSVDMVFVHEDTFQRRQNP
ncbi:uncharacterized protein LOC144715043 isoform X1 [Wolffia australiana]